MIVNCHETISAYIHPFVREKRRDGPEIAPGIVASYGASETGYDIRLGEETIIVPNRGVITVSLETITMPNYLSARLLGKSTLARLGIHLNVTEIDPGFFGRITLEISYLPVIDAPLIERLPAGCGVGVLQFHELKVPAEYSGKYQGDLNAEHAR